VSVVSVSKTAQNKSQYRDGSGIVYPGKQAMSPLLSTRDFCGLDGAREINIDFLNKAFRSRSHPSQGNSRNEEGCPHQHAEAASDQGIGIFRRENADASAGFVYKGKKAESQKSECQNNQA
jgi:hypothetical protein